MDENALTCSHCNMKAAPTKSAWRKCKKCGTLWCPNCASVDDRCSNCIGGTLMPV